MNIFDNNKLQEEIDLYLSSLDNKEPEVIQTINNFKICAKIINDSINPEGILNFLNQYYKTGLLSPLKLDNNEFEDRDYDKLINKRYDKILLTVNENIIYRNAWKPWVVHVYDSVSNEEVPVFPEYINVECPHGPLWITRGGCCKGEYISEIKLKQSTVEKHSFIPHEPINIPVSIILNKDGNIFSVDSREPKLTALRKFYDTVECKIDYKFDIRKFKKLNKYG